MTKLHIIIFGLVLLTSSLAAPSQASALTLAEKASIQASMQRHVDGQLVDGALLYLEQKTGDVQRLHPVTAHPMILTMGDHYVLCFDYRDDSGKNVPVEIFLQYMPGNEHEEARFIAIVRDITERKKVDRMKREFIASVSHELRTPLTSIRGAIGMIRSGALGEVGEQSEKMLEVATNNADRLIDLVNDLLDFESLQSGKIGRAHV